MKLVFDDELLLLLFPIAVFCLVLTSILQLFISILLLLNKNIIINIQVMYILEIKIKFTNFINKGFWGFGVLLRVSKIYSFSDFSDFYSKKNFDIISKI